jgi:predicted ferric reductase
MTAPTRTFRLVGWKRRLAWVALAAVAASVVRRPLRKAVSPRRGTASDGAARPGATVPPALEPVATPGAGPLAEPVPGPGEAAAIVEVPTVLPRDAGPIPDHGTRRKPRALWLAIYASALVIPMALVLYRNDAEPRSFMLELGSALGIAALSPLAVQLALPARLPLLSSIGAEVAVRLHRRMADILLAVVAAHVAAVMVADPARVELLRFFGEPWRAQAAIGSVVALVVLAATSFLRRRLRLHYALWRGLHLVTGALALVLAVVHTVGVGRYLVRGPAEWALVALTVLGIGALVVMRVGLFRPWSVRPYSVDRIVRERGGAITLALKADRHPGQAFIPGQFAWLKLPDTRTMLHEHPFSYSSGADNPARPEFTMQPRSGFSARVVGFEPGTRLLVDGPHGAFRPRATARGTVLLAGGIGITPSMSFLRTAAERADPRPIVLFYGARTLESVTFLDEIEALRARLPLTLVLVLSAPDEGWTGDTGRINRGTLDHHLPADLRDWQFLACGSGPFVDGVIEALEAVGVPGERVHAERFVEV